MSNQLTEKDLEEGKRIGIADCLTRPFNNPEDIEGRMQTVLSKAEEESGGVVVPVDPKAHILSELEKITICLRLIFILFQFVDFEVAVGNAIEWILT